MFNRRKFIQNSLLAGVGISLTNSNPILASTLPSIDAIQKNADWRQLITDENYWAGIREYYDVPSDFINLENGYFSPQAKNVIRFHQSKENMINTRTSWFMRKDQTVAIENSRMVLSEFLGCSGNELALTRNTTESMNIIISGYPWKPGDEVIIGDQDYGSMVTAFHQAAKRHEIVVKVAKIPLHPKSDEEVITAYSSLVTTKTRLVHITHLINLTGQVVPVAVIADRVRKNGVEVSVDSAHSVAHLKFMIPDLKADYVSASLHKWMGNPLGAGFLWMKKEHISKIYPLMADEDSPVDDIRKFEHQGTRPIQTLLTISESIKVHNKIGGELKQERLRYLMNYWVSKVSDISKICINTPFLDSKRSCAIANISVEGFTPTQLADKLLEDYKIFTVAIDHPAVKGIRVTPHLYNNLKELEVLVEALKVIAG